MGTRQQSYYHTGKLFIEDRLVWIVTAAGTYADRGHGPKWDPRKDPAGRLHEPPAPVRHHEGNIVIDAKTGAYLQSFGL